MFFVFKSSLLNFLFIEKFQSDRIVDIKTSVLHVNGEPTMITLDYIVDGTDEKKIDSGATQKDLRSCNNECPYFVTSK